MRLSIEAWWAPRVVPPKGAPNVPAHHDRRCRLRGAKDLRRRNPDARALDRIAKNGLRLYEFPLDIAVLANSGSPGYWT